MRDSGCAVVNQRDFANPRRRRSLWIRKQSRTRSRESLKLQFALDDAQRVLQAAERAQQTAEKSVEVMRTVAIAAVGGLVLVALVHSMRRKHH